MGFSKLSQVADNIRTVDVLAQWTPELEKEIEDILKNAPTPELNWKDFSAGKGRRAVQLYCPPQTKEENKTE